MSSESFQQRASTTYSHVRRTTGATNPSHTSPQTSTTDRRRNWLSPRTFLSQTTRSTHNRFASLFPRVGGNTNNKPPPPTPRPPDIQVEIDPKAAVPVLVARPSCDHDFTDPQPRATRMASTPAASVYGHSRPRMSTVNTRPSARMSAMRRKHDNPRAPTPPPVPRARRFFMRLSMKSIFPRNCSSKSDVASNCAVRPSASFRRKSSSHAVPVRRSPPETTPPTTTASASVTASATATPSMTASGSAVYSTPPHQSAHMSQLMEDDTSSSHRLSRDSLCGSDFDVGDGVSIPPVRRASISSEAPVSGTPITVYNALEKTMPSYVLQGNATFEPTKWNEYRKRIDQLADDTRFMHYLTAPVTKSPKKNRRKKNATPAKCPKVAPHPPQLAVNKLYPLAFIRLLEAHAKHAAETEILSQDTQETCYDYGPRHTLGNRVNRMASYSASERFCSMDGVSSSRRRKLSMSFDGFDSSRSFHGHYSSHPRCPKDVIGLIGGRRRGRSNTDKYLRSLGVRHTPSVRVYWSVWLCTRFLHGTFQLVVKRDLVTMHIDDIQRSRNNKVLI